MTTTRWLRSTGAAPSRPRSGRALATAGAMALLLTGCSGGGQEPEVEPTAPPEPVAEVTAGPVAPGQSPEDAAAMPGTLELSSPDLAPDGTLPAWATGAFQNYCDGENRSPALSWTGAPDGTEGYLVIMVDVLEPGLVHWVVSGIPGDATGLAQAEQGAVTEGVVGSTLAGVSAYIGPCGIDREYRYLLYALDEPYAGTAGTNMSSALMAVDGHVLDTAELTVTRGG